MSKYLGNLYDFKVTRNNKELPKHYYKTSFVFLVLYTVTG